MVGQITAFSTCPAIQSHPAGPDDTAATGVGVIVAVGGFNTFY